MINLFSFVFLQNQPNVKQLEKRWVRKVESYHRGYLKLKANKSVLTQKLILNLQYHPQCKF